MLGLQAAVDRVRLPTAYLGLSESASELAMAQFWSAVKVVTLIISIFRDEYLYSLLCS